MDSEGLLLMTNDGALANRLMHPSHEVEKCYRTWVRGTELEEKLSLLRRPMELDGYRLHPARVELLEKTPEGAVLEISIHEGRNRQVRRMCEQAGLAVTRLCRVREGALRLGSLRPGQWRFLTDEELRSIGVEP
jgi:23S rRNA pseudouridine2605 synthase